MYLYCLNDKNILAGFPQLMILQWIKSSPIHPSAFNLSLVTVSLSLLPFGRDSKVSLDTETINFIVTPFGWHRNLLVCQNFIPPPNSIPATEQILTKFAYTATVGRKKRPSHSPCPFQLRAGLAWDHCNPSYLFSPSLDLFFNPFLGG